MADFTANPVFPIILGGRALIRLSGAEAGLFLNSLITADIPALTGNDWQPAALLSPQGKILFEFLVCRAGAEIFEIEIAAKQAEAFCRRLIMYRLRRKVEIGAPLPAAAIITALPDKEARRDRRFGKEAPIWRACRPAETAEAEADGEAIEAGRRSWDALRIERGIAEIGRDFTAGEAFPHDVNYDLQGAVSLHKGCYIGQEVVSRMQHKAEIRKRLALAGLAVAPGLSEAEIAAQWPAEGAEIRLDGRLAGRLGTICGTQALAVIRLDRVAEAPAGAAPQAGGALLRFRPGDLAALRAKLP